jgi:hypothetical protein
MPEASDYELWAAARVVSMHAAGGRCGRCQPDGQCRLYAWADVLLKRWEASWGRQYPHRAPSWESAQLADRLTTVVRRPTA